MNENIFVEFDICFKYLRALFTFSPGESKKRRPKLRNIEL